MGYMMHHTIVVTSWQSEAIEVAHDKAAEMFAGAASSITPGPMNGYRSFLIAPDGSKEGWEESAAGDVARDGFKAFLRTLEQRSLWVDWVEVQFGGDEPSINTAILDHNGALANDRSVAPS